MNLLVLDRVCLAFGLHRLLDNVELTLEKGERVCLVGRNGTGKSSMLKVISGSQQPDEGEIRTNAGVSIAYLDQALPDKSDLTVYQYVASGLADIGESIHRFHELGHKIAQTANEADLKELEQVQQRIDSCNGWQIEQRISTTLTKLNLSEDQKMENLSGGWRRRASLARALVQEPDILLLDEPTNHLDLENIEWLESTLKNYQGALLFITHDLYLADQLATRIVELDRGNLSSWPGDFKHYLSKKEEQLAIEERHNEEFDKRLAQEETWIRQGIKARRTRNEGRVRALKAMREERAKRRKREGKSSFNIEDAERSGKVVAKLRNVSFAYQSDKMVVKALSMNLVRGDRIGVIGPNGSGKSTLIKLLLGQLQPTTGTIKEGTNLEIAYFDQLKEQLDFEKSVIDNVADGKDHVLIHGKSRHAISYLKDFLFTPERVMTPVKALSGGESNRLLLAKIFAKPSNLIILDEPTNDLDIETLELLEQVVTNYQGTVIVVSHDREFLNNVVTSTLVHEGDGNWQEYVGGYDEWLRQRPQAIEVVTEKITNTNAQKETRVKQINKLSYKEQRELDQLPSTIERLENEVEELQQTIADSDFFQQAHEVTQPVLECLATKESELNRAYERWDALEALKQSFNSG